MKNNNVYSLYTDGNLLYKEGLSGYGGYILDPDGVNIVEFTGKNTNPENLNYFEIIGINEGLRLAISMGIKNLEVFGDSLGETNTLNKNITYKKNNLPYIIRCSESKGVLFLEGLELCEKFENINFNWIPRKENKHADYLSKIYLTAEKADFPSQLCKTLENTEYFFEKSTQPDFHFLFSHPKLQKSIFKNNPYIPSELRTKKISKLKKNFLNEASDIDFIFIETYKAKNEDNGYDLFLKAFKAERRNGEDIDESVKFDLVMSHIAKINAKSSETEMYAVINFTNKLLRSIKGKSIWIDSNHRYLDQIFQHTQPIHKKYFKKLSYIYNNLSSYDRVFYNTFHFPYQYSNELQSLMEDKKRKIKKKIDSIEDLQLLLSKEKKNSVVYKKYFATLVQCYIRNFKKDLTRKLTNLEKQEIIEYTKREVEKFQPKNNEVKKNIKVKP